MNFNQIFNPFSHEHHSFIFINQQLHTRVDEKQHNRSSFWHNF
jgi:hypothetical protein